MKSMTINEAPCQVAYFFEGEDAFAKLKKDDFEQILNERRGAIIMLMLSMVLTAIAVIMLAGTAYWFTEHPTTTVMMVAPADIK